MADNGSDLNDYKLLPPGILELSLERIKELFGQFQRSDRRCRLFEKLTDYVEELRKSEIGANLYVDGSFIMGCVDEPDDIDLILEYPENWDFSTEVRPFEYNLISKHRVKKRYGFDVMSARAKSPELKQWIDFFSQVNVKWFNSHNIPSGTQKGLVRVIL